MIQALLLFGSETWVLSAAMERKVEGSHTVFICQITGKRAQWLTDRAWETPGAESVREAAGMKLAMSYIRRR